LKWQIHGLSGAATHPCQELPNDHLDLAKKGIWQQRIEKTLRKKILPGTPGLPYFGIFLTSGNRNGLPGNA
jgi:hypothetical protein